MLDEAIEENEPIVEPHTEQPSETEKKNKKEENNEDVHGLEVTDKLDNEDNEGLDDKTVLHDRCIREVCLTDEITFHVDTFIFAASAVDDKENKLHNGIFHSTIEYKFKICNLIIEGLVTMTVSQCLMPCSRSSVRSSSSMSSWLNSLLPRRMILEHP